MLVAYRVYPRLKRTMRASSRSRDRARGAAYSRRPSSRLRTALDHMHEAGVEKQHIGQAAYWPARAGRPRRLLSIEARRFVSGPLGGLPFAAEAMRRRRRLPASPAPPTPTDWVGPPGLGVASVVRRLRA